VLSMPWLNGEDRIWAAYQTHRESGSPITFEQDSRNQVLTLFVKAVEAQADKAHKRWLDCLPLPGPHSAQRTTACCMQLVRFP
jgi:hypothetical protein